MKLIIALIVCAYATNSLAYDVVKKLESVTAEPDSALDIEFVCPDIGDDAIVGGFDLNIVVMPSAEKVNYDPSRYTFLYELTMRNVEGESVDRTVLLPLDCSIVFEKPELKIDPDAAKDSTGVFETIQSGVQLEDWLYDISLACPGGESGSLIEADAYQLNLIEGGNQFFYQLNVINEGEPGMRFYMPMACVVGGSKPSPKVVSRYMRSSS